MAGLGPTNGLSGLVKTVTERSGTVEFLLDGGIELARFCRTELVHKGVPVSSKVNLSSILPVGSVCSLFNVRETTCIYENIKGVYYTAEVHADDFNTKINNPFTDSNSKSTIGTVMKLMNHKGTKMPRVVIVKTGQNVHHVFVHKSNVTLLGKKINKYDPSSLPVCEIGMSVIVSNTEPYNANNCSLMGSVEIGVDPHSANGVSSVPTTYESKPVPDTLDVNTEVNDLLTDDESLSLVGKVLVVANCTNIRIPREVEVKVRGSKHRVFIPHSSVLLNGTKVKKCDPADVPWSYIGMRVTVIDVQPYNANACTLTGRVNFVCSQQLGFIASDSSFPALPVPREGCTFGIDFGVSPNSYSALTGVFRKSEQKGSSLETDELLNRAKVGRSSSLEDFRECLPSQSMTSARECDSVIDLAGLSPFEFIERRSHTGNVARTGPPEMEQTGERVHSTECSSTPSDRHPHVSREILGASIAQQMKVQVIPVGLPPRRNNFRTEDTPESGSTNDLCRDQYMKAFPSHSMSEPSGNANDTNGIRRTQQIKGTGSANGMYTVQDIASTSSSSKIPGPSRYASNTGDILGSQQIKKIVSTSGHFTVQDKPPPRTMLGTAKKPIELQKLLDYCKNNLKVSSLTDQNVSQSGTMTVDQGTQTISTGDIVAFGIYPGM